MDVVVVVVVADTGTIFIGLLLWKHNLLTAIRDVILIVILTLTVSETTAINLSSCYKLSVMANMQSSRLVFTAQLRPQFGMPAKLRSLHASAARQLLLHAGTAFRFQQVHTIRWAGSLSEWQISKSISYVSFVRSEWKFFTIHRRHRCKKNDAPEF